MPPSSVTRTQPLHVVYGGAHLFRSSTVGKLGDLARKAAEDYDLASALALPAEVSRHVQAKLASEPVEDFRIDFEDGFGIRSTEEEDTAAVNAARELRGATVSRHFGIRIKQSERGLRTLKLFLDNCDRLPPNFVVTLPKVSNDWEVTALTGALRDHTKIHIEVMVETPGAVFGVQKLIQAAKGRCTGAHFGAYDYLASLGISQQDLAHPACDFARSMMQASLAGSGVWLSDGATSLLPIPPHRGEDLTETQRTENRAAVHAAWKLHYDHTRRALYNGFYQGWDLHPAQIPARLAAVYMFFHEGMDQARERLTNFVAAAAQATHVRGIFDDAATGRVLINYFRRAQACGLALDMAPQVEQVEKLLELDTGNH